MKNYESKNARTTFNRRAIQALTTIVLFVTAANLCAAQTQQTPSTDRDNPTAVTSNTITGDGVDDKTEYFYSFTAGPGDVTITLDVKAEKSVAVSSVDIALYDAKSKRLLSTYANPDHGSSKRAVETTKVRGTQTLLLEVTVSLGVDTFKIKLDGAVTFNPATGNGSMLATDGSTSTAVTPSQPAADTTATSDASATSGTASSDQNAAASAGTTSTDGSATTTDAADGDSSSKANKVNQKVNAAASKVTTIITNASTTMDSAKPAKKKKP